MSVKTNYSHTIYACYLGSVTQAIVNDFAPLLFLTFHGAYGISLEKITLLITINFMIQLMVDMAAAKFADKIGYRPLVVFAHALCALGMVGLGVLPEIFNDPYLGLLAAVFCYAFGGGLLEVLTSPIVEACPTEKKSAAMSLLHSFYCWGHVLVVVLSVAYFGAFGIHNWKYLAFLWALLPAANAFYFSAVPINSLTEHGKTDGIKKLFSMKMFWLFALMMVCSGAAEQAMSQWVSAFAESSLKVSKTVGDLAGPCVFAAAMGVSRVFYSKCSEKIDLKFYMTASGILSVVSYLLASLSPYPALAFVGCGLCGLAAGIMWPGTFSLAAVECPGGGTAMFALLALGGDLGCSLGPTVVGFVTGSAANGLKTGFVAACAFPVMLVACILLLRKASVKQRDIPPPAV